MGTAVLRPPVSLRSPNRGRSGGRRKRSPSDSESERSMVVKAPAKELVMGEVRILKRGEDVAGVRRFEKKVEIEAKSHEQSVQVNRSTRSTRSEKKLRDVSDVLSKGRLGPEPESIPKEIRLKEVKNVVDGDDEEKFAGSAAFVASPSPSDLPYPGFFAKKVVVTTTEVAKEATKDLCRLLRLDIL